MKEYSVEEAQARFEELKDRVAEDEPFAIRRDNDLARVEPLGAVAEADLQP